MANETKGGYAVLEIWNGYDFVKLSNSLSANEAGEVATEEVSYLGDNNETTTINGIRTVKYSVEGNWADVDSTHVENIKRLVSAKSDRKTWFRFFGDKEGSEGVNVMMLGHVGNFNKTAAGGEAFQKFDFEITVQGANPPFVRGTL